MNSLLSNLGPRYSRRNSTTPIILGFLLLIIAIAVLTYFITRDDDDDDKDKKDENTSENVPSIEDPTVTRTLLPDSSNSSESGTTETYEIGGGKTETYQIEYNPGISDIELSKNVKIGITWSNQSGFENVYKLDIEHYVTPRNNDGTLGTIANDASFTKTIYRYVDNSNSGNVIDDNVNYFTKYAQNLTHEFQGLEPTIIDDNQADITNPDAYSFVGTHTIKIIATYTDENESDITIDLTEGTATRSVEVKTEDLAATLELTVPDVRVFTPIQGAFTMGDVEIDNQTYNAISGGIDIHQSIDGKGTTSTFTLIRASTDNSNQFYFKFNYEQEGSAYLGYDGNKKLSIDVEDNKKIITLVSSSLDDPNGIRYFRLSFNLTIDNESVPYYIVVENDIGVIKQMAEIETEDIYNTLDWKFVNPAAAAAAVDKTTAAAAAAVENADKAAYGYFHVYEGSTDPTATHTWVVTHNRDINALVPTYELLKNGVSSGQISVNRLAGYSNEGHFVAGPVGTVWTIVKQNCIPINGKCYEYGKFIVV